VARQQHEPATADEDSTPEPVLRGRATSFDIAYLAGVSQPTVSRALRGSPMVSEATRGRIEAIARQLNYRVAKNASSLRRGTTETLALLLFEDETTDGSNINPFFLGLLGSITRAAANQGYDLLVSFQQLSKDWHHDYEEQRRADGIILLGYGDYALYRDRLSRLVEAGTHFVRWGPVEDGQPGITIGSDNLAGGRLAAQHFIRLGRRRIAFLGDASDHYPEFRDRFMGLRDGLRSAGLAPVAHPLAPAISSEAEGARAMHALLETGAPIDAVFAASDLLALGALSALAERGLAVPEDVAVLGFDDIPAGAVANPPLSTIAQDSAAAGRELVGALLALIRGERPANRTLPVQLRARRSCGG
jgi:DNA-binding LacI/PurR family transcriptional regulator